MIFRKTKSLSINMGHYEKTEIFATVEIDTDADASDLGELGIESNNHTDVIDFIDATIEQFLVSDAALAARTTDHDESFIFPYIEITSPEHASTRTTTPGGKQ